MAYMRPIQEKCDMAGCQRRPHVEVFNDRNASCGQFCRQHGRDTVNRLNREKDQASTDERRALEGR